MSAADANNPQVRSQRQRDARDEWRRLCDAMEQAQGDELAKTCRDRFQFVRTYKVYGSTYSALVTRLKRAADVGDYTFFQERGIPSDILDWRFAEQLLQDWNDKVQDKKRRLASIYQLHFGEPLDRAVRTDEEAFRMESIAPVHDTDALLQLSGMGRPSVNTNEIEELRADVHALRKEFNDFTHFVTNELSKLKNTKGS